MFSLNVLQDCLIKCKIYEATVQLGGNLMHAVCPGMLRR